MKIHRKLSVLILILVSLFVFGGCITDAQLRSKGYVKIEHLNAQVAALESKYKTDLVEYAKQTNIARDELIAHDSNIFKKIATELYVANTAYTYYKIPNRIDLVINTHVKSAISYIPVKPDVDVVLQANEELKRELDEKLTSIEELKKKNEDAILIGKKEREDRIAAEVKVLDADKKQKEMEATYNAERLKLEKTITTEQEKLLIEQNKVIDNQNFINKQKAYMMGVLGFLSLVALAGAIFSPVYKGKCGLFSAACGLGVVGLLYLEAWMVFSLIGVIAVIAIYKMSSEHKTSMNTNENIINAVQDYKTTHSESYEKLKPILTEWNTKYHGSGSIEDKDSTLLIEKILKDYGRK